MTFLRSAALGDVATLIRGITFKPTELVPVGSPGSVVCLRTANIQADLDWSDLIAVPAAKVQRPDQLVQTGDILVSSANSWNLVGKCVAVPVLPHSAAAGGFISILRPDSSKVDERFLFRWLGDGRTQHVVRGLARQTTSIANLPGERFLELEMPLPPLAEQRRIAAVLDKADAIRRKRRESLRLLDGFLRSAFLEMFGDPVKNEKLWPTLKLGELIEDGPQNGLYRPASDYGSGTPIVRINSFYDGEITDVGTLLRVRATSDEVLKYGLRTGDIMVNRVNSREFLGKSALVPELNEPTVFESNMMRFRVRINVLEPGYLVALFQTLYFKRQIANRTRDAVNQASINQDDLCSFEIRIPPVALQRKYLALRSQWAYARGRWLEGVTDTNNLFDSLAHRVFREEL